MTVGGTVIPRSTAFLASRPAATITPGLLVFVQLVMAAITTSPWVIRTSPAARWATAVDVVSLRCSAVAASLASCSGVPLPLATGASALHRSSRGVALSPTLFLNVSTRALRKFCLTLRSSIRSCGRRGPATLGVTVPRSNSKLSVKTGSTASCRHNPCSLQYRSTRSICPAARPVSRRYASVWSSTGKKPIVAPYSGAMLAIVARSADGHVGQPRAVELDELLDHAVAAEDLRDGQHQVGRRRPLGQLAGQLEPDHLGRDHVDRLAEHARLGLDPPHAPPDHAQPVDHRRVAVRPDQAVRPGDAVADHDDLGQVLQIHLVDDARPRRDDAEVGERLLPPLEELVPLAVPLELPVGVQQQGRRRPVLVHLHAVVDDQVDGHQRVDLLRVPPARAMAARMAARSTTHGTPVKSCRITRRGAERQLDGVHGSRVPAGQAGHVRLVDDEPVDVAERALQQNLDRERQRVQVARRPAR